MISIFLKTVCAPIFPLLFRFCHDVLLPPCFCFLPGFPCSKESLLNEDLLWERGGCLLQIRRINYTTTAPSLKEVFIVVVVVVYSLKFIDVTSIVCLNIGMSMVDKIEPILMTLMILLVARGNDGMPKDSKSYEHQRDYHIE